MKNDSFENRMILAHNRSKIPDEKLLMGSTKGKYPVILDDGKTIIYISDKTKEAETRLKYELLRNSRFPSHSAKNHS
jgi:c-di-AMP phosphodiesterase-like protein